MGMCVKGVLRQGGGDMYVCEGCVSGGGGDWGG